MDVNIKKQAFVFSFLAFFLSILIFAFGSYYLFSGDYTKDLDFKEARIQVINNELSYFKNVYAPNAFSFSMYNSLRYLLENESLIVRMDNNYSKMNQILGEMIINGSIDGVQNSNLNATSVNYLLSMYQNDFYQNYKGNLNYTIKAINIYEESPFYLSIQVFGEYEVTTIDNITSWHFNDTIKIKVPIYEFNDPEFTLNTNTNTNYTIRYVDLYNSNINWTLESFNDSLVNVYSSMYIEPLHKYTIGTSFINRLLNSSTSSYKKVYGFYSFDYDEEENGVYDTSGVSIIGKHYGNTRLLMKFDNSTVNETLLLINDLTAYNNSGSMFGNLNCTLENSGVYDIGCYFDGDGDYIEILDDNSLDFNNESFSLALWVKFNNGNITENEVLISKEESFILRKSSNVEGGNIDFLIYDGIDYEPKLQGINVSINSWNLIIATYDGNEMKLYINGILINSYERGNLNTTSSNSIYLGNDFEGNFLNGTIDEVGVYSKVLTEDEISNFYKERKAMLIDYKDSLYGKAIEFDGEDDYVSIEYNETLDLINYSVEFWIKPYLESTNPSLMQEILVLENSSNNLTFFLNGNNNLEVAINFADLNNPLSNFSVNEWQHFIFLSNGNEVKLYRNSKLQNTTNINLSLVNFNSLQFSSNISSRYYNGLIDEVKIYNKELTEEEITQNYYNFASKGKGCCNYITLINPNLMGFNDSVNYNKNVSYNSRLFFDYYNKNIDYNITLWNLSNISSQQTDKEYYNFMLDDCMIQAYNVFSFDYNVETVNFGLYNDSCYNYVREGIY